MAVTFIGLIAQQIVPFRGVSNVSVRTTATEMPAFRSLQSARYFLEVAGGISDTIDVAVIGRQYNGTTFALAGLLTINAVGKYVLYPATYSSAGAQNALETAIALANHQIVDVFPPSYVSFLSSAATVGSSAHCTVTAMLVGAPR